MSTGGNRRSAVVLYSSDTGLDDHRVRLVLAEKGVQVEVEWAGADGRGDVPDEYGADGELPVMVDRDLALYGVSGIIDYLDERYPHPPLMPMDPVSRARARLAAHRIERDWYPALTGGEAGAPDGGAPAGTEGVPLARALAEANDVFAAMPFFLSNTWSVLDAAVVPLLWRLPHYGIVLPETAAFVADYARRMFARPAFRASLSAREREMTQHR